MPPKAQIVKAIDLESFNAFFSACSSVEQRESDLLSVSLKVDAEVLEVGGFMAFVSISA
jgi:hypothetical protein